MPKKNCNYWKQIPLEIKTLWGNRFISGMNIISLKSLQVCRLLIIGVRGQEGIQEMNNYKKFLLLKNVKYKLTSIILKEFFKKNNEQES